MDANRFDAVIQSIGTTASRREALVALFGGALGLLAGAEAQGRRKRRRRHKERRRRGVSQQGPCGDGSGKHNECERDRQCCTGYCHKKRNRCRCKKLWRFCTEDRNCCANLGQPMTCQDGACQTIPQNQVSPPPPPPQAGCQPEPVAQTCAGRCAIVANNCGNAIDCGPCSCGACPMCQTCNAATGQCVPVANGTLCSDGDACTQTDTCQNGICVGTDPIVCAALDQCHDAGACNSATGVCSNPNTPDDTACNDGDICTTGDSCQGGACVGTPIAGCCTTDGQCDDGDTCTTNTCNTTTNQCVFTGCCPVGSTQCTRDSSCCGGTGLPGGGVCSPSGCCVVHGSACPSGCPPIGACAGCCSGTCGRTVGSTTVPGQCECGDPGTPCGTTGFACCSGNCQSGACL